MDWGGKAGTLGSQQQWMETLHWQTQHFRQEHSEAQILRSKSNKFKGIPREENSSPESIESPSWPRERELHKAQMVAVILGWLVVLRLHFMQNKNLLVVKQAIIRRVLGFEIAAAWIQINFKISDRTQLTALHATFIPVQKKGKRNENEKECLWESLANTSS